MISFRKIAVFFFLFSVFFPSILFAQTTGLDGFDLRLYRPSSDGSGFFNLHGSKTLSPWNLSTSLEFELSHGVLAADNPTTGASVRVIDDMYTAIISAALGLPCRFDVGIQAPITFFEQGNNFNNQAAYDTASLGELLLDIKWNFLVDDLWYPGIAFLNRVTFPTGQTGKFTSFSLPSYEAKLIVDKKINFITLIANVGYQIVERRTVPNIVMNDRLTFGAGVAITPPIWNNTFDILGEVDGYTVVSQTAEITTPVEWLAGLRKRFGERISLHAGGGSGITGGVGESSWRLLAGLTFRTPLKKAKTYRIIETIHFPFDDDRYYPKYKSHLNRTADKWKQESHPKIRVRGHADDVGDEGYNLELSRRRAETVGDALSEKDVPSSKVLIEFVGESEPVTDSRTPSGRAKNRRVDIYLPDYN